MSIVSRYVQYRQDCNADKLLKLLADDIVLTSSRDGTFTGKEEFAQYLTQVPPVGTWDPPMQASFKNGETVYVVNGTVPAFFMNWPVEAVFTVNKEGLIRKIDVQRK